MTDLINSPQHYVSHPSGIEVIEITRHMGFCLGNVVKYAIRCDLKGDAIEDLRKAIKYLEFEIETREREIAKRPPPPELAEAAQRLRDEARLPAFLRGPVL